MQRRIWIVALVVMLSTAALLLLASQTWADFTHTKDVLLSYGNEPCSAVKPRLATSPDGHQLAVAWVQETGQDTPEGFTCRAGGFGVLRWATEESSYIGWATPLKVFLSGQGTACVNDIDVAVDADNVAHVIATIQDPCDLDTTTTTSLHYRACTLDGGNATCGPDTTIIAEDPQGNDGYYLLEASIAVNDQGMPFVVYGRRQVEGALASEVRATAQNSNGTWRTPFLLSSYGEKAHRPALTWGQATDNQGYVHVVWETHEPPIYVTSTNGRVKYIRCPDTTDDKSDCGTEKSFFAAGVYPRPAVAVSGPHDRVVIAWNRYDELIADAPCTDFGLFYHRSDNNGTTFLDSYTREVLSDLPPGIVGSATHTYRSTEDQPGTAETEEYISYLRPAVAMDSQGLPLIAWQAEDTVPDSSPPREEYVINTTQAITWYGSGGINWQEENRWGVGDAIERRINPDIAPASLDYEPGGGIHMVYMKQDVLTDIGEFYRIYYSYTGDTLYVEPTPVPTVDEAATSTPMPNPNQNPYQAPNTVYLPMVLRSSI